MDALFTFTFCIIPLVFLVYLAFTNAETEKAEIDAKGKIQEERPKFFRTTTVKLDSLHNYEDPDRNSPVLFVERLALDDSLTLLGEKYIEDYPYIDFSCLRGLLEEILKCPLDTWENLLFDVTGKDLNSLCSYYGRASSSLQKMAVFYRIPITLDFMQALGVSEFGMLKMPAGPGSTDPIGEMVISRSAEALSYNLSFKMANSSELTINQTIDINEA